MAKVNCAICLSRDRFGCEARGAGNLDANVYECEVCGEFLVSRTALFSNLDPSDQRMTAKMRAILSYRVRQLSDAGRSAEMWTTARLDDFFAGKPSLPSPAQQATNIIRLVGDLVVEFGEELLQLPSGFCALVGSPSTAFAVNLLLDLKDRGLISALVSPELNTSYPVVQDVSLTLGGWQVYESEKQGQISGNYGFVALKFGDDVLDPLLNDHIKPAIGDLGYNLVDMRDVARAGVIDNLLRVQIRDSAFVLVDLTHENAGAYWEAGYAEGLGKPVLYLCERDKFAEKKTHFDTNHCTTVLWHVDEIPHFLNELTATIRRSLDA